MTILSKACEPDSIESHITLKLSFTNTWGLGSNFVDSFLELNFPDILAVCETTLDDLIDSGYFSVRGDLPLIRKNSITHMHGLAVYVKEGFPFAREYLYKNQQIHTYLSTCFTSLSILLLFPLSITFFVFVHGFWFYFI